MEPHRYDVGERESMAEFELRQRVRIHRRLQARPPQDKRVEWALEIRGSRPAQINLDSAPIMPGKQEPRS